MKQVLMEILDVQDKFLVGTTNKTGVLEAINAVKALDSLTTEIKETITATTKILKELEVHDNILPKPRITDILFSSDIYKFNFSEIATIASSMDAYSKLVLKELEVPNTNIETLVDDFVELVKCSFRMSVTMSRLDIPNGFKIFAESLQSLDSFGTDIEKYLRLTDPAYIKGLTETLNSLMQSSTKTEIFLNSAGITRFKRQLDVIDKVFSTTVRASDKKTLIGFPQGSKDFEALLNDLDDDWLKKVTTLLIFGATVAILVISGLFAVFMWFRKRTTKQDIKQVEKKSIS
uniref:Domain of unknown function WSN domain-containing protein n=1 Tax=Caenorhabditis japonica TaxID=281687 RepID=A0A8R1DY51_CAEJA